MRTTRSTGILQIVLVGDPGAPDTRALLREVHSRFVPNIDLLFAEGGTGQAWLTEGAPFVRERVPTKGRTTAYVCEVFACHLPVTEPATLGELLDASEATPR